jgi:hypothetical protein
MGIDSECSNQQEKEDKFIEKSEDYPDNEG